MMIFEYFGYGFPGGHIQKGESILEGGIRELKEETKITLPDKPYSYKTLSWNRRCGRREKINLILLDVGNDIPEDKLPQNCFWINPDEIPTLSLRKNLMENKDQVMKFIQENIFDPKYHTDKFSKVWNMDK